MGKNQTIRIPADVSEKTYVYILRANAETILPTLYVTSVTPIEATVTHTVTACTILTL
jgi:hypothetical protein